MECTVAVFGDEKGGTLSNILRAQEAGQAD
jgi:hypothetical protein